MKIRQLIKCIIFSAFTGSMVAFNAIRAGSLSVNPRCYFAIEAIFITAVVMIPCYYGMIKINRFSLLFSVVCSVVMISGGIFNREGTLFPQITVLSILFVLCEAVAFTLLFLSVYAVFTFVIESLSKSAVLNTTGNNKKVKKSVFELAVPFFFALAVYGSWLALLRPNIATYDSANQLLRHLDGFH